MNKWLNTEAIEEDVVVSSRIRLARNIENKKFPSRLTIEESDEITNEILNGLKEDLLDGYQYIRLIDLPESKQMQYVESHLISPKLVENKEKSSFLLRDDQRVSLMINEEDHLRIQILSRGLNFKENWEKISQIDDLLDKNLNYAFDKKWGYLTACPTNVGTGLRVSSMLHLPCLSKTGNMKGLIEGLKKINITTRGFYGEGTTAIGNMYQISNQKTIGESEEEIIQKLEEVINQIINRERETRQYLLEHKRIDIEDKIFRSIGILKYARKLSIIEAMQHLSNLRLGMEMNIIDNNNYKALANLIMNIQPYSIKNKIGNIKDDLEIEIKRSDIIRKYIKDMEGY